MLKPQLDQNPPTVVDRGSFVASLITVSRKPVKIPESQMVPALGGYPATANPAQVWTRRLCPECRISPTLSALRDYKSKMYWSSQSHLQAGG